MPRDDLPTVSVIVPVRDGLPGLLACVERLLAQDYPHDRYEVVIVDNGSAQSPKPHLPDDPRLTVLAEPTPGSYAARNTGVRHSTGAVLAFTDADCLPEPGWVRESVAALTAEPGIAMIGGRVEIAFERGGPHSGPEWYEYANGFPQELYVRDGGFAVTANMTTWRRTLDEVGPFDARLRSGGDGEWGRRVRAAGHRQAYAAEAVVRHPARVTWAELRAKHIRTTHGFIDRLPREQRRGLGSLRLAIGQLGQAGRDTVRGLRSGQPSGAGRNARYLLARWFVAVVNAKAVFVAVLSRSGSDGE